MYEFPDSTIVNKELKVIDVLKQIKANQEVKNDANKIDSLKLRYIINAKSINCETDLFIKEIYVFELYLNKKEIPYLFIEALDKTIYFHTYFIHKYHNEVATQIAFKEIDKEVIIGRYYFHNFSYPKLDEINIFNNMGYVYKSLLVYEMNVYSGEDENPKDYNKRVNLINRLKFQISKTESALKFQTQPKKKYLYHNRLIKYYKELEFLLK